MNKQIEKAFSNGKAFIVFVTSGDPDLETTQEIVYALDKAGCSLVKLGIPFSDPTAEVLLFKMRIFVHYPMV